MAVAIVRGQILAAGRRRTRRSRRRRRRRRRRWGRGGPADSPGRGGRGNTNQIRGIVSQSFDTSALRRGAVRAERSADDEAGLLAAAIRRHARRTAGDSEAAQRPADVLLPQLHRQPLEQSVRRVFDRADAGRARPAICRRSAGRIIDPATGQPFRGQPDSRRRGSIRRRRRCSRLIPLPNQTGDDAELPHRRRRRRTSSTTSTCGSSTPSARRRSAAQGAAAAAAAAAAAVGGGRAGASNLNITFTSATRTTRTRIRFRRSAARRRLTRVGHAGRLLVHEGRRCCTSLRFQFNRQQSRDARICTRATRTSPAQAGMLGVSTDPFDWGAPNLSFSTFSSLRDVNPATADRSDDRDRRHDREDARHAHVALRRRLSRHPLRQPDRRERPRQLRLHRPLYRRRLRRLPARAAAAGDRCSSARDSSSSARHSWDLVPAGRLAVARQADDQRRPALRVLLAVLGGRATGSSTLDVAPGFTAAVPVVAGGTRPVLRRVARHDRQPDPRQRSRRAIGIAWQPQHGHGRPRRLRHQLQLQRLPDDRAAARRPAAVRGRRRPRLASPPSPLPLATALLDVAAGRDDQHVRASIRTTASASCRSGTSTSSAT